MCRDFIGSIVNGDKIDGLFCISCSGKSWERCSINTILYELNSLFNIIVVFLFFFFKEKQAYERRISDWSSDVCSSDLFGLCSGGRARRAQRRRSDGGRCACRHPRPGDGWGARDDPRRTGGGDLPRRDEARQRPPSDPVSAMIPGEIITGDDEHVLNDGLPVTTIAVANRGDRPIQVGSHYHFAETNAALLFDRKTE